MRTRPTAVASNHAWQKFLSIVRTATIQGALGLSAFAIIHVASARQAEAGYRGSTRDRPIVETEQGPIQGLASKGIAKFLGIPYAAPPVGNLRWRPPVKHDPWRKVLQTTKYAPRCAQSGQASNANEDCLHLNIFAPADAVKEASDRHHKRGKKGLPVMVWIFGGGLTAGSPNGYDGSALAKEGTIVVTVNYRLNIFGFLLNPALQTNGKIYGNFGLLDQQMGLKWVQKNIAMFGGDPHNVTLFGESGGAEAVGGNLLSPSAHGLFQRAILQSGVVDFVHTPYQQAVTQGKNFASAVGCSTGSDAQIAQCLRKLPAEIVEANAIKGPALPLVDGSVLPLEPETAFQTGKFNKVPIMNGGTRDEYAYVVRLMPTAPTEEVFVNYLKFRFEMLGANSGEVAKTYPEGTVDKILREYPANAYPTVAAQYIRVATDGGWAIPSCAVRHFTRVLSDQVPVYHYELRDRTLPNVAPLASWTDGIGGWAYHTADLPYVFPGYTGLNGLDPGVGNFTSAQKKLSAQMISAWTNFARTGNPNGRGDRPWPRYKSNGRGAKQVIFGFDTKPAGLTQMPDAKFVEEHHCRLWDGLLPYHP